MDTTELKEAAEKATKGDWWVDDRRRAALPNVKIVAVDGSFIADVDGVHMRDRMVHGWTPEQADAADARALANANYIALANPATILALIAEVETLRLQNEALTGAHIRDVLKDEDEEQA